MFKPQPITFQLEGVKGTLELRQGIMGQANLYQDGQLLKRKGFFRAKYPVVTDNGQGEMIELKRGLSFAYSVVHRGKEVKLEENLAVHEYILGILPLILLVFLGGVIGAIIGLMGVTFVCNFMRREKRIVFQLLIAACAMLACWAIYFILALMLSMLFYA